MARCALQLYDDRYFGEGVELKEVAERIWDAFRVRPASEFDGLCLNEFLITNPNSVVYADLGSIPDQFQAFVSKRIVFLKDKELYENMDLETFSAVTGIRFVEFARIAGGSKSKGAIVRYYLERWAIAFFRHVSRSNCLNDFIGCGILGPSFRSNYVIVAPDPKKLCEEHGIVFKKFMDEENGSVECILVPASLSSRSTPLHPS